MVLLEKVKISEFTTSPGRYRLKKNSCLDLSAGCIVSIRAKRVLPYLTLAKFRAKENLDI